MIGLAGREIGHFLRRERRKRGISLLDVFEPRRGIKFVENDLARQLDQRYRHRWRILARHHDARALVSHLTHDFNDTGYKVRTPDVLMSLVKNDELVERLPVVSHVSEELEQHNEKAERLILLDELIPEVDDHKSPRTDHIAEMHSIIDIFGGEI